MMFVPKMGRLVSVISTFVIQPKDERTNEGKKWPGRTKENREQT
jgi:hypothetical protein